MWAKIMNWGLRGLAGAVLLAVALNFWVLWFHPMPKGWMALYRIEHPFIQTNWRGEPARNIQWLWPKDYGYVANIHQEDDAIVEDTLERLEECLAIMRHWNHERGLVENTLTGFMQRPVMSREDHRRLVELWAGVPKDARLRFRRPFIYKEEVKAFESQMDRYERVEYRDQSRWWSNTGWVDRAYIRRLNHPDESVASAFLYAKEFTDFLPNQLFLQYIHPYLVYGAEHKHDYGMAWALASYGGIEGQLRPSRLSDAERARVAEATARWNRLLQEALNPTPEPWTEILLLTSFAVKTFEMIEDAVGILDNLPAYEPALRELVSVDYGETLESLKSMDEISERVNLELGWLDMPTVAYSRMGLFRAQSRLMKRFCRPESNAYNRFDLLSRLGRLPLSSPNLPNFGISQWHVRRAQARLALAQGGLELVEHLRAERPLAAFAPKAIDPFTDEPIRFGYTDAEVHFTSLGPSRRFDGVAYSSTNGLLSAGDIEWAIGR